MVLRELCALRGVSGDEGRVRAFIRERIESFATWTRVDRMGNLIAFKEGFGDTRRHIVLAAHMDEVGMVVCGINDSGLLSYDPVGSIDPRTVVSKPVRVGDEALPGVIGAKAIHLQKPEERTTMLPHNQLFIDIGAKDKAAAEKLVELGDSVAFESEWREFGDGLVKARALDSRTGCMVLMSLLEGEYPCDVTCVFTVQKEIGARGAAAAAYALEADAVLVLDGAVANDLGQTEPQDQICRVKGGVALSFMDRMTMAGIPLYARLRKLAMDLQIPHQLMRGVVEGNDASAFQRMAGPVQVCALNIPCRNIHTPSCVAAFADMEAQYRLADAFLTAGGVF